jgi:hypothetical protein
MYIIDWLIDWLIDSSFTITACEANVYNSISINNINNINKEKLKTAHNTDLTLKSFNYFLYYATGSQNQ